MNKLREQIAQKLPKPNCVGCEYECGKLTGCLALEKTADAIIALLQPRMLNKDEAEKALEIFEEAGYTESHMSCQCLNHRTIAKLKLIQEEDSE